MISVAELIKHKELNKPKRKPKIKKSKPEKTYLNQQEQKEIIIIAAFVAEWQEMILRWQELDRPTDQIKWAKSALTFIFKTMDTIMEPLQDDQKMKVIRRAGKARITIEL
ncbi:hypothetical protein [Tepidanaerobacter syntrophicus]|uniref:Uncharacterized protein n=1 Tax=Tepidanaerobacter syntrophicus TaxID=224999 RepID=A0A0U9HG40_9FIRM|nr:hypothetical protein [Tepidanaerobacter syntrophicus]GAQ24236.1 hypothetical protein TSYNT_562 [Tepidanaerobacter syntrophicus]